MQQEGKLNRRSFLANVAALGVAGLVGGAGGEIGSNRSTETFAGGVRLAHLNADDFAKLVGQTFRIQGENGDQFEMTLTRVTPQTSGRARAAAMRSPFSVMFSLRGAESFPHQTCVVEHAAIGRFPLFLGAVGQPTSEHRVEAVFG